MSDFSEDVLVSDEDELVSDEDELEDSDEDELEDSDEDVLEDSDEDELEDSEEDELEDSEEDELEDSEEDELEDSEEDELEDPKQGSKEEDYTVEEKVQEAEEAEEAQEEEEVLNISENREDNLFEETKAWDWQVTRLLANKGNSNWKNGVWGPIRTGVLAELYYQVLTDKRSFRDERARLKEIARNPDVKFNPLYAAQVFNELRLRLTYLRDSLRLEQPYNRYDLEDQEDIALPGRFFVPFQLPVYTQFVGSWMDELDENEDSWVPKQPVLLFSFLMDENNSGVLLDRLVPVVDDLRAKYDFLSENQYKPFQISKIRKSGPWRKDKDRDIVQLAVDKTQGLQLSDSGNALLTIFLGIVIEMARNGGELQKGLKLDTSSFQSMFAQAYVYLCTAQENKLKSMSKNPLHIPYSFSEWGLKRNGYKVKFPWLLDHVPQSLSHLNIRKNDNKPECSACQKGYITYYGRALWGNGKEEVLLDKDGNFDSGGNYQALCVRQLDDLLKAANIDMDSNNPWYIDFVGTWQQAQRRLDAFKKKQSELYDIGDPRYNWVDYYYKWLILKVDVAVKRFADISDVKEGQEVLVGAALEDLEDTGIFSTLKEWVKKIKDVGKVSAVILYKVISLILVSPMTQELLIQFCNHIKESICQQIAIQTGKVELVRTSGTNEDGTPVLERFSKDTGEWFKASKEEQDAWTAADKKKSDEWLNGMAYRFFDVLSNGNLLSGWMQELSEMGAVYFGVVGGWISKLLKMLEDLPVVGSIFKTIGGASVVTPIVVAYLQREARSSWKEMVAANKTITRLKKLYEAMFSGWSDCLTSGKLIIKDGAGLGENWLKGKAYLKEAFSHAQFNIPYYAILVLNELAHREENPDRKLSTSIDTIIDDLVRTELVAGTKALKKLEEQARKDKIEMEKLEEELQWEKGRAARDQGEFEYKQGLESNRRDADGNLLPFNFEANRIKRLAEEREYWIWRKKWLGYAVLSVAVFMATGGASGIAQVGTAISGAVGTAGTAGTAVVGAAGSVAGAAGTAISGAAGAATLAGTAKVAASATTTILTATEYAKAYPEEIVMMGSSFSMVGYRFYNTIKHWNDSYKIVKVHEALQEAGVRKMLFYSQLRDKIEEFRCEKSKRLAADDVMVQTFKKIIDTKKGFKIQRWADKPYIDYGKASEFFMKYGSPHAEPAKEKLSTAQKEASKASSTSSKFRALFKSKWLPKNSAGVQRKRRTLFVL